ncbi:hypothetical protein TNIN_20851 [Trichonephila inaurata madagascariensis]|uniref:Uncharacterized protein n=1 Tax=Trichonephila inaurata madagascariensis TaxID=2747483 RepID=A0A8X6YRG9_9ARAC|nr:hypothetical protein TNIN_20851 [Trichonephila inaurata madagascariensis]
MPRGREVKPKRPKKEDKRRRKKHHKTGRKRPGRWVTSQRNLKKRTSDGRKDLNEKNLRKHHTRSIQNDPQGKNPRKAKRRGGRHREKSKKGSLHPKRGTRKKGREVRNTERLERPRVPRDQHSSEEMPRGREVKPKRPRRKTNVAERNIIKQDENVRKMGDEPTEPHAYHPALPSSEETDERWKKRPEREKSQKTSHPKHSKRPTREESEKRPKRRGGRHREKSKKGSLHPKRGTRKRGTVGDETFSSGRTQNSSEKEEKWKPIKRPDSHDTTCASGKNREKDKNRGGRHREKSKKDLHKAWNRGRGRNTERLERPVPSGPAPSEKCKKDVK